MLKITGVYRSLQEIALEITGVYRRQLLRLQEFTGDYRRQLLRLQEFTGDYRRLLTKNDRGVTTTVPFWSSQLDYGLPFIACMLKYVGSLFC